MGTSLNLAGNKRPRVSGQSTDHTACALSRTNSLVESSTEARVKSQCDSDPLTTGKSPHRVQQKDLRAFFQSTPLEGFARRNSRRVISHPPAVVLTDVDGQGVSQRTTPKHENGKIEVPEATKAELEELRIENNLLKQQIQELMGIKEVRYFHKDFHSKS